MKAFEQKSTIHLLTIMGWMIFFFFLSLSPQPLSIWPKAFAGEVLKIKDNRVLLDLSDLPTIQVGDELSSFDTRGNRSSSLRVRAIRPNQAVAEILSGSPQVGQKVQKNIRSAPTRPNSSFAEDPFSTPARPRNQTDSKNPFQARPNVQAPASRDALFAKTGTRIGGHLTQATHNLSIELPSKNRANLSGSSLNLGGFYDYDYSENLTIRLSLLWLQFNVSGNSPTVSDCTGQCEIKFSYLSGGGMMQYNLSRWGSRYWIGAGANLMFQISQNHNLKGIRFTNSTNQNFSIGLGADFGLSQDSYLPVFAQYDLFFGDNPANSLHLGLGYGIRF